MRAERFASGSRPPPHAFASGGVDRAAERRRDPAWVEERLRDPATRFVPVWQLRSLVRQGEAPRADLPGAGALGEATLAAGTPILLGEDAGVALFALEIPSEEAAAACPGEFVDLRQVGALLPPGEAALLAHARAMVYWHRRHRYCGDCGAPTAAEEAGHLRVCRDPACGARHFPRTDPAIIVLVTAGERCLLGRQPSWPPGRYATLAGFVEPGESLEDAVAREVREEAGIVVRDVRYHSSQPWPFPASLMLGFTAAAATEEIRVDPSELEDARWFSREDLRASLRGEQVHAGAPSLPPPISIAHALIRDWLDAPATA